MVAAVIPNITNKFLIVSRYQPAFWKTARSLPPFPCGFLQCASVLCLLSIPLEKHHHHSCAQKRKERLFSASLYGPISNLPIQLKVLEKLVAIVLPSSGYFQPISIFAIFLPFFTANRSRPTDDPHRCSARYGQRHLMYFDLFWICLLPLSQSTSRH